MDQDVALNAFLDASSYYRMEVSQLNDKVSALSFWEGNAHFFNKRHAFIAFGCYNLLNKMDPFMQDFTCFQNIHQKYPKTFLFYYHFNVLRIQVFSYFIHCYRFIIIFNFLHHLQYIFIFLDCFLLIFHSFLILISNLNYLYLIDFLHFFTN